MESTVERHLRDLLFEQDAVSIPGLGTLQTYYTSASIDEELGKVHPPSKKLRFEEDAHGDGDDLINKIVEKEGKSTFDARMKVDEFVERVRMGSREDRGYVLDGLGIFRANSLSSGNPSLDFEPDRDANFNMSTYGLRAVSLPGKNDPTLTEEQAVQESTIENHYPSEVSHEAPIEAPISPPITAPVTSVNSGINEEPKRVSEVLEDRLREDRKVAEEAEDTDYLDKLREEFERKKREDELKRRATIAGGAVAGTSAIAGGFLANKKNEDSKKEVIKEVKPVFEKKPATRENLLTEVKKEIPHQQELSSKEPPKATYKSEKTKKAEKNEKVAKEEGSRSIFDVLSENVVAEEDAVFEKEEKKGSALYWVLPLLMLILMGVLVIQLDILNTDLRSVFGFGNSTEVAENNVPIAESTDSENDNVVSTEEIRKAVAASEADLAAMEAEDEGNTGEGTMIASEDETREVTPEPEATATNTPKASSYDQNGNPINGEQKDPTERSGTRNQNNTALAEEQESMESTPIASNTNDQKDPTERSGTRTSSSERPSGYFAGIGIFGDKQNATKLAQKLRTQGEDAYAVPMNGKTAVVIYAGDTKDNAQRKLEDVRREHEKSAWLRFLN